MLDARDAAPPAEWLEQLTTARLPTLASLANAIREDQPAVVQGITTPFNSGVNEGRITDLKLQKRIMAGRGESRCSATASSSWPCSDAATCDGASPAHGGTLQLHGNLARASRACTPTTVAVGPRGDAQSRARDFSNGRRGSRQSATQLFRLPLDQGGEAGHRVGTEEDLLRVWDGRLPGHGRASGYR